MAQWYTCTVHRAGPANADADTPSPTIYLGLSDRDGAFAKYWFFAANSAKREMLATALTALSTGMRVTAFVDPPNANNTPYTQCHRLYVANDL